MTRIQELFDKLSRVFNRSIHSLNVMKTDSIFLIEFMEKWRIFNG